MRGRDIDLFPDNRQVTVALSDEDVPGAAADDSYPALRFDKGCVALEMKGKFPNVRVYHAGLPLVVDAAIRIPLLEAKLTGEGLCYDKFS